MNRTETNCQPCAAFIFGDKHDCYGGCEDGVVVTCQGCGKDHHSGGWQTCPKRGRRKNCRHPACVAVEKEASVETTKPMTGMPAAEFEIDRLQKANAEKREEIAALRAALAPLTTYVDFYEYGRAWAGRPHALMDAARAALGRGLGEERAVPLCTGCGHSEMNHDDDGTCSGSPPPCKCRVFCDPKSEPATPADETSEEQRCRLTHERDEAQARSARMRDLLVAELRWHEQDPENQRCTLSRVGALRDALGLEPGDPLPVSTSDSSAIDCNCGGAYALAPGDSLHRAGCPRGATTEAPRCLGCGADPGKPCHKNCKAWEPAIAAHGSTSQALRDAGLPPLPLEAMRSEIARLTDGFNTLEELARREALEHAGLAERVTALEPLFRRVEIVNALVCVGPDSHSVRLATITSAMLDLARLVAIQAETAKDTATAQGLLANGIRTDAAIIVAKLGGGK